MRPITFYTIVGLIIVRIIYAVAVEGYSLF